MTGDIANALFPIVMEILCDSSPMGVGGSISPQAIAREF
jgi:hypothetical protein